MTLKSQITSDLATFFNSDEFAEAISYNSATIYGIIERLQDPDFGQDTATRANVTLKASDVADLAYGETLSFDGLDWLVEGILQSDSDVKRVSCRRKEARRFG